ncbi:hypothetical protein LTR09_007853 [Extremus antarcticus]|uniref:Uncharacterized protein n=1 Tax=Extremus antarcticus TaxID=702011 RepID=A0AAJ0G6S0_9PEZI|nr:hypothetical protein LTR09_007853 [Extremus antarcticus]
MAKAAIPIVLLGRMAEMGRIVTEHLRPEIGVINFFSSPEAAKEDLPRLLAGQPPSAPSGNDIGTQDYSRSPQAVLSGLGYYNEVIDELRAPCRGGGGAVPWVDGGLSKAQFDDMMASGPPISPSQQGPASAVKVKSKVLELINDGKGGVDGVYRWHEGRE